MALLRNPLAHLDGRRLTGPERRLVVRLLAMTPDQRADWCNDPHREDPTINAARVLHAAVRREARGTKGGQ